MRSTRPGASRALVLACILEIVPLIPGGAAAAATDTEPTSSPKAPAVVTQSLEPYLGPTVEETSKHAASVASSAGVEPQEKPVPSDTIGRVPAGLTVAEMLKQIRLAALFAGMGIATAREAAPKAPDAELVGPPDPDRRLTPAEAAKMQTEESAPDAPRTSPGPSR